MEAAPGERHAVYAVGALMLAGILFATGFRRQDAPRELLIIAGLLMGLALVICPVAHNFYFILLLPLITALVDCVLARARDRRPAWNPLVPLVLFLVVDVLARLPGIGPWLRDAGAPLATLVILMIAGWRILLKPGNANAAAAISSCPAGA